VAFSRMAKVHDENMASLTWTSCRCVTGASDICIFNMKEIVHRLKCVVWSSSQLHFELWLLVFASLLKSLDFMSLCCVSHCERDGTLSCEW